MKRMKILAMVVSALILLIGSFIYVNMNSKESTQKSSATVTEVVSQPESPPTEISELPKKSDASEEGKGKDAAIQEKTGSEVPNVTNLQPDKDVVVLESKEDPRNAKMDQKKDEFFQQFPQVSDIGVVGDLMLLVYSKSETSDIVGDTVYMHQANGLYRFFRVDVMNNGKKAHDVDVSMFSLVAPDGTTYDPDPTATVYAKVEGFQMERLNPGTEAHGYVAFDLPADIHLPGLVLRITNGSTHVDLNVVKQ